MAVKYKAGETLGTTERILSKHELITQKIIESLESNIIPWKKPWKSINPQNLLTKKEYRGINHFLLGMVPTQYPTFATFNQIKSQGGSVLKGSKSAPVYFYNFGKKGETDKRTGKENEKSFAIMKQYAVFTMEQTEGLDLSLFIDPVLDFKPVLLPESLVNAFTQSQLLKIIPAQNAAYSPSQDHLIMPLKTSFFSVDAYYSTIFHEIVHSTGHKDRLKREGFDGSYHKFGSKGYAFEELVAEFGASMLASYCGVNTSLEDGQNAAYIKGWLKKLNDDKTLAYKAASKAQVAVDFILEAAGFNAFNNDEQSEKIEA
jgi:antirestriction protein ArdC